MKKIFFSLVFLASILAGVQAQQLPLKIALLKYRGGGDWYSVVDALENLTKFCNKEMQMNLSNEYATIDVGSAEIFNYPFLFLTGHGNVVFSDIEAENLRIYLLAGGFLFIDDDYGIDPYIRPAMKKVFPDISFTELPFQHPIYHQKYDFSKGLPKVHQHSDKPPQGFGLLNKGRLMCFYGYESNISDGWESPGVHKDPEEIRQQSLKMGANIIRFAFGQ